MEGIKDLFLRGRYADTLTVSTVLVLFWLLLAGIALVFPPGGLLVALALLIALRYLWIYDGAGLAWRRLKGAEKGGVAAAVAVLAGSLSAGSLFGIAPQALGFAFIGPLAVLSVIFMMMRVRPEQRVSLEDFFITGWTHGSLAAAGLILIVGAPVTAEGLLNLLSPVFSVLTLMSLGYLALAVVLSMVLGVARNLYGGRGLAAAAAVIVIANIYALWRFAL